MNFLQRLSEEFPGDDGFVAAGFAPEIRSVAFRDFVRVSREYAIGKNRLRIKDDRALINLTSSGRVEQANIHCFRALRSQIMAKTNGNVLIVMSNTVGLFFTNRVSEPRL